MRALTEAAGAELVAAEAHTGSRPAEVASGSTRQQISVDGAMVPLRGGEWREVRTLVIGELGLGGETEPVARRLSYFSRMTDAQTFTDLALGEVLRRGTDQAPTVAAVQPAVGSAAVTLPIYITPMIMPTGLNGSNGSPSTGRSRSPDSSAGTTRPDSPARAIKPSGTRWRVETPRGALEVRDGVVRFAVAPNRVHHLHAGEVAASYPGAQLWVGPGLERKRPDLVYVSVLDDDAPAPWKGQVDQVFFRGRPYENEVVFCHRASRTLILCDLAFNFGPRSALPTRVLMWLLRSYGEFGPSKLDPLLIRDRRAARESLERILAWDFDRVIVAHGEVLESGGREALRRGYAWLLAA
jgi:hypothetical protein